MRCTIATYDCMRIDVVNNSNACGAVVEEALTL